MGAFAHGFSLSLSLSRDPRAEHVRQKVISGIRPKSDWPNLCEKYIGLISHEWYQVILSQKEVSLHKVEAWIRFFGKLTVIFPLYIRVKSFIDIKNVFFKRDLAKRASSITSQFLKHTVRDQKGMKNQLFLYLYMTPSYIYSLFTDMSKDIRHQRNSWKHQKSLSGF